MKLYLVHKIVAGSHLYGTATKASDIDYRGVCLQPPGTILGLDRFDQAIKTREADVTYYGITKFVRLALAANPNILDILFAPPDTWLVKSELWKEIYEIRHLFLSSRVRKTFAGYAASQLKRIRNHKRWIDDPPKEPTPEDFGVSLGAGLKGEQIYTLVGVYRGNVPRFEEDLVCEILRLDPEESRELYATHARDLFQMVRYEEVLRSKLKLYKAAQKEWRHYITWRDNRNKKRFELEREHGYDTKHAAHLFRLLVKAKKLLETGDYDPRLDFEEKELVLTVLASGFDYDRMLGLQAGLYTTLHDVDSVLPDKPDRWRVCSVLEDINECTATCSYWNLDIDPALATLEEW